MVQMRMFRQWRDAIDMFVANSHATRCELARDGVDQVEDAVSRHGRRGRAPARWARRPWQALSGGSSPRRASTCSSRHLPASSGHVAAGEARDRRRRTGAVAVGALDRVLESERPRDVSKGACRAPRQSGPWKSAGSRWRLRAGPSLSASSPSKRRCGARLSSQADSGGFCETVDDGRSGLLVAAGGCRRFVRCTASVAASSRAGRRHGTRRPRTRAPVVYRSRPRWIGCWDCTRRFWAPGCTRWPRTANVSDFSVVIPTYRRTGSSCVSCLEGFSRLNYPRHRFEVIVVDDGSPERPDAVIARWRDQLDMKLIRQANAGPAAARNLRRSAREIHATSHSSMTTAFLDRTGLKACGALRRGAR